MWPKSRRKGGQVRFTAEQTNTLESRFDNEKYLSPNVSLVFRSSVLICLVIGSTQTGEEVGPVRATSEDLVSESPRQVATPKVRGFARRGKGTFGFHIILPSLPLVELFENQGNKACFVWPWVEWWWYWRYLLNLLSNTLTLLKRSSTSLISLDKHGQYGATRLLINVCKHTWSLLEQPFSRWPTNKPEKSCPMLHLPALAPLYCSF